ncbi:MAG TPA: PCMD domain-containing protein [Bacteroidales bacterium]|jgi:hypothetical protein|nr:PCMD domain-containing protein [Bacteroidales bacterium]HPD23910.1 PCMD domain-containing protein [Bacteroidales bacterium]HRS99981.1 PCMD domain-containing protein [Bacteroidales bacterium]HRT79986.1 PCMD domain-containing protein [Bacteroidales bacterium]
MKNLLFLPLIFVYGFISGQAIPNNSFEEWYQHSAGHLDPVGWNTANPTTNVYPINKVTTERTDDAYDGNFAVKLTSKTVLTFVAPGFITLGDFNINLFTQQTSITGGINFYLKPEKLKLYYKYTPSQGDFFRIGLWMLRNDGTQIPDTVATALYEGSEPKNSFTPLEIELVYRNDFTPEILNITAVSSNPDAPVAGSVLIVDKIELEYSTLSQSTTYDKPRSLIFPSPASDIIYLNDLFDYDSIDLIKIFDIQGKKLFEFDNNIENGIDINSLQKGTYVIKVYTSNIIHSQKFIKL